MTTGVDPQSTADGLKEILGPVEEDLQAVEETLLEVVRVPARRVRPLIEHVKRFQGKKLRPALTVLAGRCFGDIDRTHHQLGAVVELIHTATLVHDDVLDDADVRRKVATVNREWGNETAVLLGDYLFATAFALSASLENRLASRYLSWISGVVCQGEILQILETGNLDLEEEVYLEVIEKKTAILFSAAARVGAEYQGAPQEAVDGLAGYGMKLGTAFQVIDDCLDLDGDPERVGKTLGTDARQGKATLPVIQFLRTASEGDAERMRDLLATGDDAGREEIRELLDRHGALEYARDRARDYARRAVDDLEHVPPSVYRDALEKLALYTLSRRR